MCPMPKGDTSDMKRAQEQTEERFRKYAGADRDFAKDQAARARDRLERRSDEGRGPLSEKKNDSSK